MPSSSSSPPSPPSPLRRLVQRVLGTTVVLVVVAIGAVAVLAHRLDQPWVKRRVQALALAHAGLAIDYGATELRWRSGLRIRNLVVRSPPETAAVAPELARIGQVDVEWTLSSLRGKGPRLTRVALADAALTLAVGNRSEASPEPSTPLSKQAAALLSDTPPVAQVEVARATVTLLRMDGNRLTDKLTVRGLALRGAFEQGKAGFRLHARLGSQSQPLALVVDRELGGQAAGGANALLWFDGTLDPAAAHVALDVRLPAQRFAVGFTLDRLLHLEAAARFDARAGRTQIVVGPASAVDGAAILDGTLELSDAAPGEPLVRRATGEVDLGRLLRALPEDFVPLRARGGHVRYEVAGLVLAPIPRVQSDGMVSADADVEDLEVPIAQATLKLSGGRLSVRLHPDGADSWSGFLDARAAALDVAVAAPARPGPTGIGARDLHLRLDLQQIDADAPLASRGRVAVALGASSLQMQRGRMRATGSGLDWKLRTKLHGGAPYEAEGELPIGRLRLWDGGRLLADAPARIGIRLSDVFPDVVRPLRTSGAAHAEVALGPLHAQLALAKKQDGANFTLSADAPSLSTIRLLLPRGVSWTVPWERMSLALRSHGRIDRLTATPRIEQQTEIVAQHPAFSAPATSLSARTLKVALQSSGTLVDHTIDSKVETKNLRWQNAALGDQALTLSARIDRAAPSVRLRLDAQGGAGPDLTLGAQLAFDRGRRALVYDVDTRLSRLAALAPLAATVRGLSGFDLSRLELGLSTRGSLSGVIDTLDAMGGTVRLSPRLTETAAAKGTIDLHAQHIAFRDRDRVLRVPDAKWHAELGAEPRTIKSDLAVGEAHLAIGDRQLDVAGLTDTLQASISGDLLDGQAEVVQTFSLPTVKQDFLPGYVVGDCGLTIRARRDRDGVIHVSEARLDNRAAGTALSLRGALELGESQRRLSLRGELKQELARAWTIPQTFTGHGPVSLQLRVESADLRVFRTLADLRITGATVRLPRAGIAIESIDGEIPLGADLRLDRDGVHLLRDAAINPYSELRFADQHPMLDQRSFISIGRITTPLVSVAPLAGNLRIEDSVISMSQFEMGVRGGLVTGQLSLDWSGADSSLTAHVRATGVQSSHGEPFDGNAAMVVSGRDRSIDGRAEILRIGRRHLLDLLDVQDPHRTDAAMNRVRRALGLGYPDRIRLSFNHGFASMRVTFGGLARLVRIDELHGIPVGPLVDKALAPVLNGKQP